LSFSIVTTYKLKRDGALDPEYWRARAQRAKRLSKAKPMLKPVLQAGQKASLEDAPIQKQSGKLGKAVAKVHLLRIRKDKIIFGTRVEYSPFYAGWYRRAFSKELVPWTDKMAKEVVDVLLRYIEEGRK